VTYAQFIEEIRRLADQGAALIKAEAADGNHNSELFRNWRHEAESTVAHAWKLNLPLPAEFKSASRTYREYGDSRPTVQRLAFNRDMADSVRELRYLIEQFDKFGTPVPPARATSKEARLAAPEKVTVRWLIDNVTLGGWVIIVGILTATFMLGIAVDYFEPVRSAVGSFISHFGPPPVPKH
jgi:hypothetical protein